jgi:hypothetical protein
MVVWLEWGAVDDVDVTGYEVSRNDVVRASVAVDVLSYEDPVPSSGNFVYKVRSFDDDGNYSAWSDPVLMVIDEWREPTYPSLLRLPLDSVDPILPADTIGRTPLIPPRSFDVEEEAITP